LEIPSGGISKCLSPIREVPTPLATPAPSPALTPIMPRSAPLYFRSRGDQINSAATCEQVHLPFITVTHSDDDDEEEVVAVEVTHEVSKCESHPTACSAPSEHEETKSIQLHLPFKINVSYTIYPRRGFLHFHEK
jgi:hypothetical protein